MVRIPTTSGGIVQQGRRKRGAILIYKYYKYFSPLLLPARHLLFFLIGATPNIYPSGNLAESHQRINESSTIPKKIDKNCLMSNLLSTQVPNLLKPEVE
jgi:hypothetical protein